MLPDHLIPTTYPPYISPLLPPLLLDCQRTAEYTRMNPRNTGRCGVAARCCTPEGWLDLLHEFARARSHAQTTVPSSLPLHVPYRRHQPWTNWGRTAHCTPAFTFYPQSVEDLQQIVHFARATGRKLRVAATGHSWSALVSTDEILVSIRHLNNVTMDLSDEANPRVVVESGVTSRDDTVGKFRTQGPDGRIVSAALARWGCR
jgi:hypothetical protein